VPDCAGIWFICNAAQQMGQRSSKLVQLFFSEALRAKSFLLYLDLFSLPNE
jgi:hypothetical protein